MVNWDLPAPSWRKDKTPVESVVQTYAVRQIDKHGAIISEKQVEADSADKALRELRETSKEVHRIEVYNASQEQVRQVLAEHWRVKRRR